MTQQDIRKLKSFQMKHQEILGLTLWNIARNTDTLKNWGVASGGAAQAETSSMVWPCLEDAYQSPSKTADEVRAKWQENM